VFGARAGCAMREERGSAMRDAGPGIRPAARAIASRNTNADRTPDSGSGVPGPGSRTPDATELATVLWQDVGLFRDREGLMRALRVFEPAWKALDQRLRGGGTLAPGEWGTASIVTVGLLIARAALRREESRGGHYRSDFPDRDDINWKRRVSETRE
jgi:L-aspartate oxidase